MANQSGNTLLISLIILLVLTIVGISSVSNVTLNQRMATNYRDADTAFQAAEAALAEGEAMAETLSVSLAEDHFDPSCSGANCFTASCNTGKCFNGTYSTGTVCNIDEPATAIYRDETTWTDSSRHFESVLNFPGLSQSPRYVVEFLCYVLKDPSTTPTGSLYNPSEYAYFYRITSFARGANEGSRVMLQSTYKVLRN